MEPINFFDRIKSLFDIVSQSSFFLMLFGIIVFTLVLLIVNVKTNKKIIKIITAIIYGVIIILFFVKYGGSLLSLGDTVIEKVFTVVYFPNYISYICMMVISLLLIIVVFMDKTISLFGKYSSIFSFSLIIFLFIMTLETITSNSIDITNKQAIYSNDTLVILIQTSTIVFVIWLALYTINLIVNGINNQITPKREKINKDIFNKLRIENPDLFKDLEDPEEMTQEDFEKALRNYQKKTEYKDFLKYTKK